MSSAYTSNYRDDNNLYWFLSSLDASGTLTFAGATVPLVVPYKVSKFGKMVMITLEGGSFTKDGTVGTLTASTPIPSAYQPTTTSYMLQDGNISGVASNVGIIVQQSGVPQAGIMQIYNASSLAGTFGAGATVVFRKMTISFSQ